MNWILAYFIIVVLISLQYLHKMINKLNEKVKVVISQKFQHKKVTSSICNKTTKITQTQGMGSQKNV